MSSPSNWLVYLVIGKIVIHIWGRFQLPDALQKHKWFAKLHDCPLCGGVWIYAGLSFLMGVDLLSDLNFRYIPIINELITGTVISWIVWIFSLGWSSAYDVVIIE